MCDSAAEMPWVQILFSRSGFTLAHLEHNTDNHKNADI